MTTPTPDPVADITAYCQDPWRLAETVLRPNPVTLLHGPPAMGKSHAAEHVGLDIVEPDGTTRTRETYSVTLTRDSTADSLLGYYLPCGPIMLWIDGPAAAAMRSGGRLIVNEVDKATGDAADALHMILDSHTTARLTLPRPMVVDGDSGTLRPAVTLEDWQRIKADPRTGVVPLETLTPAPGYQAVCTTNVSPEDLPEAIQSRCTVPLLIDVPSPVAIQALPEDLRPLAEARSRRGPDLRSLFAIAALREDVGEAAALAAVLGPNAGDTYATIRLAADRDPGRPVDDGTAFTGGATREAPVEQVCPTCDVVEPFHVDADGDARCRNGCGYYPPACPGCGDRSGWQPGYDDEDNLFIECCACGATFTDTGRPAEDR